MMRPDFVIIVKSLPEKNASAGKPLMIEASDIEAIKTGLVLGSKLHISTQDRRAHNIATSAWFAFTTIFEIGQMSGESGRNTAPVLYDLEKIPAAFQRHTL
jgi:hypothetical protein